MKILSESYTETVKNFTVAIPSDNKETQSDLDKNSNEDIKDNEVHPY